MASMDEEKATSIGFAKEHRDGERRVAVTPSSTKKLVRKSFFVQVEEGAGEQAGYTNEEYEEAGATIVSAEEVWKSDVLVKVTEPADHPDLEVNEFSLLGEGQVYVSLLAPNNDEFINPLKESGATALSLQCIPRISRAQKMDILSSQAGVAGYRAVIEAANVFGRMFTGQTTAAGTTPPAKILIIGAGVAGLTAIGTAASMGAVVRAFDVRPEVKEQVESLHAEFLEVDMKESGSGTGGYAKLMSPEFIAAEMALFTQQAKEVDIVITTAQIPGRKPPLLFDEEQVNALKTGSVIVDLAGNPKFGCGNCSLTKPGEAYVYNNKVTIIGYMDMNSRMARQSSELFASNIVHLLTEMGGGKNFTVDMENNAIRPAVVVKDGEHTWPPPKPKPQEKPKEEVKVSEEPNKASERDGADAPLLLEMKPPEEEQSLFSKVSEALPWLIVTIIGFVALCGLSISEDTQLVSALTIFLLACAVGFYVIWNVTPALHTPLMSVTNAISGIIFIAGLVQLSNDYSAITEILSMIAMFVASINIVGGFLVTQRMLNMFFADKKLQADAAKKEQLTKVVFWGGSLLTFLYCLFLLLFRIQAVEGWVCAPDESFSDCFNTMLTISQLIAALLFILSLSGLSNPESAQNGNYLGSFGMVIAIVAASCYSPDVEVDDEGYLALLVVIPGAIIGYLLAKIVKMTQMPQMVGLLNGFGGLAAALAGIATAFDISDLVEQIETVLAIFIGTITFFGSLIACAKLASYMPSRPIMLPLRNYLNIVMFAVIGVLMWAFIHFMGDENIDSMMFIYIMAAVSSVLGVHLIIAIGGGDMPVVVSMLNSYSGWATAAAGFMLNSDILIITGSLVGSSGAILSYIMCKYMNRSFMNVMLGGYGGVAVSKEKPGAGGKKHYPIECDDATELLLNARRIIITPGYGMAVAKAQHEVAEITKLLRARGIKVQFCIHPVAGRLPGHMNVLLAEAHVPYDIVEEMDNINPEFEKCDVAIVIGANDTANPVASDPTSLIAGMPVCEVWNARTCVVIKRSLGVGYAGIDNPLFYHENTRMYFGDAKKVVGEMVSAIRALGKGVSVGGDRLDVIASPKTVN